MDEKERLRRQEKVAILMLMNVTSQLLYCKDDLRHRLESVPDGYNRLLELGSGAMKLLEEVRDTIPDNQRKSLQNMAMDHEIRLVPKCLPDAEAVAVDRESLRTLIDLAQAQECTACVLEANEVRKCKLYQAMENVVPLDNYESTLCPYSMAVWEE